MSWGPMEPFVFNSDKIGSVGDSLFLGGTDLCLGLCACMRIYTTSSEVGGLVSSWPAFPWTSAFMSNTNISET